MFSFYSQHHPRLLASGAAGVLRIVIVHILFPLLLTGCGFPTSLVLNSMFSGFAFNIPSHHLGHFFDF